MPKGRLIVLEGTDGAGKSTQLELIKKYIKENDLKYDYVHFPKYGHNEFSTVIAKFLQGDFGNVDEVNPYFVANIYAMDRFLFLPELNQMLEDNDIVLLDRYIFSGMAFQAGKYKDQEKANKIISWLDDLEFNFLELPYPDLTLFLDVPINVVEKRLKNKRTGDDRDYLEGKQDIHEADLSFQARVRQAYIDLEVVHEYNNYHILPCVVDDEVLSPLDLFRTYRHLIKHTIDGL